MAAEVIDTAQHCAQVAVVLSYNGRTFAGFARQPGQRTVQGNLEEAFSLALRRPVETVCAGRTDAGVHARAQVVSFPITAGELGEYPVERLKRSFQALTDDAISIQSIALMPLDFSARFSAVEREYRYLVVPGARRPLFLADWAWDVRRPLDAQAMDAAGKLLLGEHDFKSFCMAASAEGKNTVRALSQVDVLPVNILGEDALSIRVTGNAFLHSMVRTIVGSLVAVGSGKRPVEWMGEALAACDRRAAGETAPAHGLVFWRVAYEGGIPCYEQDGGALPQGDAEARQNVELAQAFERALERDEERERGREAVAAGTAGAGAEALEGVSAGDSPVATGGSQRRSVQDDALLSAKLPQVIEEAAAARGPEGTMRRNEPAGPAIAPAERTRRIAPADPQPAEGEVSFTFDVPQDSAATRAAKAQRQKPSSKRKGKGKGIFGNLFG